MDNWTSYVDKVQRLIFWNNLFMFRPNFDPLISILGIPDQNNYESLHKTDCSNELLDCWLEVGMGKGPKRTLEFVNYGFQSRPLIDPCPQSLGLDLDSTQKQARSSHIMQ